MKTWKYLAQELNGITLHYENRPQCFKHILTCFVTAAYISLSNPVSVKPSVADQAVLTTGRHHKLNTHYFNLMLIMC